MRISSRYFHFGNLVEATGAIIRHCVSVTRRNAANDSSHSSACIKSTLTSQLYLHLAIREAEPFFLALT